MATNIKKVQRNHLFVGTGAPTDGDLLVTDESTHPLDSVYVDSITGSVYVRNAVNKSAGDFAINSDGPSVVTVYQTDPVVLTDDQIKALPTTRIDLTEAPGVGKMFLYHNAFLRFKFSSGEYTNIDGSCYLTIAPQGYSTEGSVSGDFPSIAADLATQFPPYVQIVAGAVYQPSAGLSAYENKKLQMMAINGSAGNFTGGHPDNTMEVTVFYSIVDL